MILLVWTLLATIAQTIDPSETTLVSSPVICDQVLSQVCNLPMVTGPDHTSIKSCSVQKRKWTSDIKGGSNKSSFNQEETSLGTKPLVLNIETLIGARIHLIVHLDMTVLEVKQMIQNRENIPFWSMDLVSNQTLLEDGRTLSYYNIGKESSLRVIVSLRGGVAKGYLVLIHATKPHVKSTLIEPVHQKDIYLSVDPVRGEYIEFSKVNGGSRKILLPDTYTFDSIDLELIHDSKVVLQKIGNAVIADEPKLDLVLASLSPGGNSCLAHDGYILDFFGFKFGYYYNDNTAQNIRGDIERKRALYGDY